MITCEKCHEEKDESAFPYMEDEFGAPSPELGRTLWCRSCIGLDRSRRGASPSAGIAIAGTTVDRDPLDPTPQQAYYIEHKEERTAYARARYWRLKGHAVPPPAKRAYKRRLVRLGDPSLTPELQANLEEQQLKQQLLSRMNWVGVCWRDWREQLISESKGVAAAVYKTAVRDEEKVRARLGYSPRPLSGDPVVDAIFHGEDNSETNGDNGSSSDKTG